MRKIRCPRCGRSKILDPSTDQPLPWIASLGRPIQVLVGALAFAAALGMAGLSILMLVLGIGEAFESGAFSMGDIEPRLGFAVLIYLAVGGSLAKIARAAFGQQTPNELLCTACRLRWVTDTDSQVPPAPDGGGLGGSYDFGEGPIDSVDGIVEFITSPTPTDANGHQDNPRAHEVEGRKIQAVGALSHVSGSPGIEALIEVLGVDTGYAEIPGKTARGSALEQLGKRKARAAVDPIIAVFHSEAQVYRVNQPWIASRPPAGLRAESHSLPLERVMTAESFMKASVAALIDIGDPRAVPALTAIAEDQDYSKPVRKAVRKALGSIEPAESPSASSIFMPCPHCGKSMHRQAKRCPYCRTDLQ